MNRKYRIWNIPFQQYERDNLWSLKPDGTVMWGTAEWPEAIVEWATGLQDKTGKMIFEGDIIHWDWEKIPYLVYWGDKTCQFTTDMRWLWSSIENVEILGNIHEYAELLED